MVEAALGPMEARSRKAEGEGGPCGLSQDQFLMSPRGVGRGHSRDKACPASTPEVVLAGLAGPQASLCPAWEGLP